MTELNNFVGGNFIKVDGQCKKLKDWAQINNDYGLRKSNCNTKVLLIFEDGSKKKVENLSNISNC